MIASENLYLNVVKERLATLYEDKHCSLQLAVVQNKPKRQCIHSQTLTDRDLFVAKMLQIQKAHLIPYHPSVFRNIFLDWYPKRGGGGGVLDKSSDLLNCNMNAVAIQVCGL